VFEVGVASALGLPVVGYGAEGIGVILASAATFAANAEEALQVLADLLRANPSANPA
jgi:nucleoside 2-deoxyribosyltransferase